jgi:epoxide hydrolase-like predicted phosphatase
MIKAIIFDVGGVIVDFDNDSDYYPYLSKVSGISKKRIKRMIEGRLWELLDKDRISQRDFDRALSRRLGIAEKEILWYESYAKAGRVNPKVVSDIKKLSKSYKVAYLSNVDLSRYTHTLRLLKPYKHLFNHEFASCYLHLRKPSVRIFERAVSKMHMKPSEVIFIDNTPENIAGARRAGLKGILFKNSRGMEVGLRRLGVRL